MREPDPVDVSEEIQRCSAARSGSGRATGFTCPRVMVAPTGYPVWWQACSRSRSWEKPAPREVRIPSSGKDPAGSIRRRWGTSSEIRQEALTLLDSCPACEVGSCMDPTRLPRVLHPLAPESQTTCERTQ